MNMAKARRAPRIAVAQPVIQAINTLRADQAAAVRTAIRTIGIEPGEPVDLPTARPGILTRRNVPRSQLHPSLSTGEPGQMNKGTGLSSP